MYKTYKLRTQGREKRDKKKENEKTKEKKKTRKRKTRRRKEARALYGGVFVISPPQASLFSVEVQKTTI